MVGVVILCPLPAVALDDEPTKMKTKRPEWAKKRKRRTGEEELGQGEDEGEAKRQGKEKKKIGKKKEVAACRYRCCCRRRRHRCFLPERPKELLLASLVLKSKERKIARYYKKQEKLLKDFNEMESISSSAGFLADAPTEDELRELAKSERMAVNISNFANLILFVAKVYASVSSRSMAVIASTLDSFLDLLFGLILLMISRAMSKPNQYRYPIGKRKRMQPVRIIVFASVMATLSFQVIFESGRQIFDQSQSNTDSVKEK